MWKWLFGGFRHRKQARSQPSGDAAPTSDRPKRVLYARIQLAGIADSVETPPPPHPVSDPSVGGLVSYCVVESDPTLDDSVPPKTDQPERTRRAKAIARAKRFSKVFSDMSPNEARLLFAIHRRRLRKLAQESPAMLQRDLHRFVLSSRGQRLSRNRPAPSVARVRVWVVEASQKVAVSPPIHSYPAMKAAA